MGARRPVAGLRALSSAWRIAMEPPAGHRVTVTMAPERPRTPAPRGPGRHAVQGRHAARPPGPGRRRRGPSRKVRLRRTLAGTILTLLVVVTIVQVRRELTNWPGETAAALMPVSMAEDDPAALASLRADTPTQPTGSSAAESVTPTAPAAEAAPADPATAPAPAAEGPVVVESGTGEVTGIDPPAGTTWQERSSGRLVPFTIAAEGGLGIDTDEFAATVVATLSDERGWQNEDDVRFRLVTSAERAAGAAVSFTIVLASPTLTDTYCAPLRTGGQVSCHLNGRAVINARRWLLAVPEFGGDVQLYRQYVINHEVGHALGHGHATCPGPGRVSPVMAQQTLGLKGCQPWAWPAGDGR